MSSPSLRQNLVKNKVQGRGSSVTQQRTNHRNTFINRLKSLRIQEIDKFRNINESELDCICLLEMKMLIMNKEDLKDLVDAEEITKFLQDIDEEIAILKAEEFEKEELEEAGEIAESLMNKCNLCDSLIVAGTLCDTCLQVQFS